MTYDIAIIGAGPGGCDAAIRAAQLGLKAAVIEQKEVGGTCLNHGCIPTKTLLHSANVLRCIQNDAQRCGIEIPSGATIDFPKIIAHRKSVVQTMQSGLTFILEKHKIERIFGTGMLISPTQIMVRKNDNTTEIISANHIILAVGARPRSIADMPIDEKYIISSTNALALEALPQSMLIAGSGAVGSEMAYFFATMGTQVTLIDTMPVLAPSCDMDVSRQIERSFRKMGINVLTSARNINVEITNNRCRTRLQGKKGDELIDTDIVLSAVGVQANIDGIGLEAAGIAIDNGKIKVDKDYRTSVPSVYAVGDVIATPALAHAASAEGRLCVERIAGISAPDINYDAMPSCIFVHPEIACVGLSEQQAVQRGMEIKTGKAMFTASGKAVATGANEGFVKLIFDAKTLQLVGAHCIGAHVTEMLGELTMAVEYGFTANQISHTIHAHPTMYESISAAAQQAVE